MDEPENGVRVSTFRPVAYRTNIRTYSVVSAVKPLKEPPEREEMPFLHKLLKQDGHSNDHRGRPRKRLRAMEFETKTRYRWAHDKKRIRPTLIFGDQNETQISRVRFVDEETKSETTVSVLDEDTKSEHIVIFLDEETKCEICFRHIYHTRFRWTPAPSCVIRSRTGFVLRASLYRHGAIAWRRGSRHDRSKLCSFGR